MMADDGDDEYFNDGVDVELKKTPHSNDGDDGGIVKKRMF